MTDFNYQNSINSNQKYSPLTSDYDNPSNNITRVPQIIQTNITPEENNLNKNTGEYIIYKTPYGCCQIFSFICFIIVIIFSFFFALIFISSNPNNGFVYFTILFPIFGLLLGFCFTSSYYIIYDSSQKRIILKKEKIFNCIKKNEIIQINDIRKVIFKKYEDSDSGKCFKINLILANEMKVTAVDVIDNGREYTKAFQSLKNVLPEEIYFEELGTY